MNKEHQPLDSFNFSSPGIYKIKIEGELPKAYSMKLSGMQITISNPSKKNSYTTLVGMLKDQTALSGILNTLYELQMPLLLVKKVGN